MGQRIHIIGGGTFSHVRSHLALAAPAFGGTARRLRAKLRSALESEYHVTRERKRGESSVDAFQAGREYVEDRVRCHLTKMADHTSDIVTNEDVGALVDELVDDPETRIIILNAALCDYDGSVLEEHGGAGWESDPHATSSGKYETRLKTSDGDQIMRLTPADKIIGRIRKTRKDIFAVGFKTTTGATPEEQYAAGLHLLKANSLNLVLANDTVTRLNMVVTPEEAHYFDTTDREDVLDGLVRMVLSRSQNTFTRSTVVDGPPVAWDDPNVPGNLREVVNHLIARGAYKPFRGATVGHFATKIDEGTILTSRRKRDFNRLPEEGLIRVEYEGDDRVIAYGGKPSVGGQSQRAIFRDHPELDCIAHAHVPLRPDAPDVIPVVEQWPNECGSHQCGQATSNGLRSFSDGAPLKAVMLDNHGPNIVFARETPAAQVIAFIERNFALEQKTGGVVA